MKTFKFLALSLLATMIASCSSEEVALTNKEVAATLTGNIGSSLKTRAYDNMWEADDEIGVFIYQNKEGEDGNSIQEIFEGYDGSKFIRATTDTANTREFVPENREVIKYPSSNNKLYFHAYWPWTDGISTTSPYFIPDWANQNDHKKLDLLVSNTEYGDKNKPGVELKFRHVFSRILLTIKANSAVSQIQEEELATMEISAENMNVETKYDVVNDTIENGETALATPIVFKPENNGKNASAIICPDFNTDSKERIVYFKLGKKTFKWEIEEGFKFEAGNSYNWEITLTGKPLVKATLTGTIINWTNNDEGGFNLDIEDDEEDEDDVTPGIDEDKQEDGSNEGPGEEPTEDSTEGTEPNS